MDNCVVDGVETFKMWTPIILAIVVFIVWHLQKGKEVVANEAKDIILKIIEVEKLNNSISNKIAYMNEKTSTNLLNDEIEEFKSKTDNLHKDFDFIYDLIKNEDIKKVLDKYLAQSTLSINRYNSLLKSETSNHNKRTIAIGLQREYINCGIKVKKYLMKYILYKLW